MNRAVEVAELGRRRRIYLAGAFVGFLYEAAINPFVPFGPLLLRTTPGWNIYLGDVPTIIFGGLAVFCGIMVARLSTRITALTPKDETFQESAPSRPLNHREGREEFDVRPGAEDVAIAMRQSRMILLAFTVLPPASIWVLVGRIALGFGYSGQQSLVLGLPFAALATVIGFALVHWLKQPGPTKMVLRGGSVEFIWDSGKQSVWDIEGSGPILLWTVNGPHGEPLKFGRGLSASGIPVPSIRSGRSGRTFALTNEAVMAAKAKIEGIRKAPLIKSDRQPKFTMTEYLFPT